MMQELQASLVNYLIYVKIWTESLRELRRNWLSPGDKIHSLRRDYGQPSKTHALLKSSARTLRPKDVYKMRLKPCADKMKDWKKAKSKGERFCKIWPKRAKRLHFSYKQWGKKQKISKERLGNFKEEFLSMKSSWKRYDWSLKKKSANQSEWRSTLEENIKNTNAS
jgi:hypothetical protein